MARSITMAWDKRRLALGFVLLAAGCFVLADISLVSKISALVIGGAVIVVGVVAGLESIARPTWHATLWRLALAVLYIAFGALLITHRQFQAIFMHTALASALIASGGLRVGMALFRWSDYRWLAPSGVIGVAGGIAIYTARPFAGLGFIAAILGLDLLTHGVGWIMMSWRNDGSPGQTLGASS